MIGGAFEEEYEEAAPKRKELFYTEGPASLKQARLHIAHFSLDRAASRLAGVKRRRESPDEDEEAERLDTVNLMKKVCLPANLVCGKVLVRDKDFHKHNSGGVCSLHYQCHMLHLTVVSNTMIFSYSM